MISPESRWFFLLLGGLAMLTSLAVDMNLPALPTVAAEFHASADRVQLTLSLFLIGYAAGQLFSGPLSDRFGRRRMLLIGLGVYTAASFASAAAWSIDALVAIRLVHGFGACAGASLSRAIVRDHFGGPRAAQALSAVLALMSAAPMVAPYAGGLMLVTFGWRSIFLLLGCIGLGLLAIIWFGFAESLKQFDPAALRPSRLAANYRSFFANRISVGCGLVNCFTFASLFAFISGSPFVLIEVYGVPSDRYGIYFAMMALGLMVGSLTNNRLLRRMRGETLLHLALIGGAAAGAVLLFSAWTRWGGTLGIVLPVVAFVYCQGIIMSNASALAMEPMPHMAGTASAILGASQMASASLGGYVTNRLYDHTPLPMAAIFAAGAVAALGAYYLLVGRRVRA